MTSSLARSLNRLRTSSKGLVSLEEFLSFLLLFRKRIRTALVVFSFSQPRMYDRGSVDFFVATNISLCRYDKSKFGAFKFKNLFKFSMILRAEMTQMGFYKRREEAAGGQQQPVQPKGDTKTQPLFEYTADTVDACAKDKLGLCIIGIFDGSPMNDGKEAQLEVLREVQNAPSNKGRILHFMWVDLTCHPSFGAHFGVSGDTLPTVLAVSPKKQAWAQHFGAFEANKVGCPDSLHRSSPLF